MPAAPPLVRLVDHTGEAQLQAPSFTGLTERQKKLAYWLSQAAIAIDPIVYDQLSPYGAEEKRLIEGIARHADRLPEARRKRFLDYAQLFWINHSNYNNETAAKFLPGFDSEELAADANLARLAGAWGGSRAAMRKMLRDLQRPIFDPNFAPRNTDKSPPAGEDIITASANNFYPGLTLADLRGFQGAHPLNSRVVKKDGKLVEEVYRAGTPDGRVPPGLYAPELDHAVDALEHARSYAPPPQQRAIDDLVRYYRTGARSDWLQFDRDWVGTNPTVDFVNGFVEVYRDARGQKATAESFVCVTDQAMSAAMRRLADHAAYFEARDPWPAEFKNPHPHPPVAKAVEAVIETGDMNVNIIGDNLPNEAEIHREYGSKSFIFTGSMRAMNGAVGDKLAAEFSYTPAELERYRRYGEQAEEMMTAMHEVIGHGSGRLSPRLAGRDPADYLKQYYSTLEETRADLVALWNFWDPELRRLGLISNLDVAREAYDNEARAALFQLREVPRGDEIEEDHRRGTQLIVNFVRATNGAIQPRWRDGKVYLVVVNYADMRAAIGKLLGDLMRIKATGDYAGAEALIQKYGVHFNAAWRDQVLRRVAPLDLPTYWGGINPKLTLAAETVTMSYPRNLTAQRLAYAHADQAYLPVPRAGAGAR